MKISDLQKYLAAVKRKHGDIEVIEVRYSDYKSMDPVPTAINVTDNPNQYDEDSKWAVIEACPQQGGWYIMRDHYTLRNLPKERRDSMGFRPYLLYKGN